MIVYLAMLISGLVLGGGATGWWLSQRWKQEVAAATQSLQEIAEQHQQTKGENQDLQQKVADLTYQLGEANKSVKHLQSRLDAASDDPSL